MYMLHTPNTSFLCIAALLLYTMMMHTAQVKAGSFFSELDPIHRRCAKSWGYPQVRYPSSYCGTPHYFLTPRYGFLKI